MIWKELEETLIFTGMKARDWQEVLKKTGAALQEKGDAKDSYIDALIQREIKYPTGINMGETGVAIPHTDPDEVLKEGIAIAILAEPVAFRQMGTEQGNVMVKLVFVLAIREPGSQVDKLRQMLKLLRDKKVLGQLENASDRQSVINIIREKEEFL